MAVQQEKKATSPSGGLSALWKKEDYWAVWLGLGIVLISILLWATGSSFMKGIAIKVPTWSEFGTAAEYLGNNIPGIIGLFLGFLLLFSIAIKILGHDVSKFVVGFAVLFIFSLFVTVMGSWTVAKDFNLEAPLLALAFGLIIGNFVKIPAWLDAALKTEFFVKTGIVLMGATLPFTLIMKAGPVAFLQATIISVVTFTTIYFAGTRLFGLDRRFASTLAAGGSICGVSASIAIGGAVKADKNYVSVAISLVVVWAVVMIFSLPILIKMFGIDAGPAGAWIGTSEFADAAGMAAAAAIGEQSIKTFTLVKVVGRDMFVGIWAFLMAIISVTQWEKRVDGSKPNAGEIWGRFPKFVLGFFVASIIVTILVASNGDAAQAGIEAAVIKPLKELRNWAFIFTFLSIGFTTRFRDLTSVGWKPFAAFTTGVLVNVPLGFLLSVLVMGNYWANV
ncbi:MAG: YeiH family protein [Desulfitobacterium sp.]